MNTGLSASVQNAFESMAQAQGDPEPNLGQITSEYYYYENEDGSLQFIEHQTQWYDENIDDGPRDTSNEIKGSTTIILLDDLPIGETAELCAGCEDKTPDGTEGGGALIEDHPRINPLEKESVGDVWDTYEDNSNGNRVIDGVVYDQQGYPIALDNGPIQVGIGKPTPIKIAKAVVKTTKKVVKAAKKVGKATGWVVRKEFKKLDPAIQKKVAAAIENGIVEPTAKQGIIKLTSIEAKSTGYLYKIKILGKGGDIRIYGNPDANGHIVFDKIIRH
jgi:hypothetical protein